MKDFDGWNESKKVIDNDNMTKRYHIGDIWWCSIGINIGREQDGLGCEYKRPVLILNGLGPETCLIVPLSLSTYHHPMRIPAGFVNDKKAVAIISQIRVIDCRRLLGKICYIDSLIFKTIKKAVKDLL